MAESFLPDWVLNIYNKTLLTPAASLSTSQRGLFANESVALTLQQQRALCLLLFFFFKLPLLLLHIMRSPASTYMHLNANTPRRSLPFVVCYYSELWDAQCCELINKHRSKLPDYIIAAILNLFVKFEGNLAGFVRPLLATDPFGRFTIDSVQWQTIDSSRVSE